MAIQASLARFLRDTVKIPRILDGFHDIRINPRIRLRDILLSVFLMPVFGLKALLRLDCHLRSPEMLKLFRCPEGKNVVVSDTTIARVLRWLSIEESQKALLKPFSALDSEGLLTCRLTPDAPRRRLGIADGSFMGGHYLVACLPHGQVNYAVSVEPCKGRGHELKTTQRCIPVVHEKLGPSAPQLWLFDGLYFNKSTFETVRNLGAHLLVKCKPDDDAEETKAFRTVLEDAKWVFDNENDMAEPVATQTGFDSVRCCSWSMKRASAKFANCPVNVFLLAEDFTKGGRSAHVETWITTTDLSLDFAEAREAAHLRWQIENEEFKRLSHLGGTKTVYFKDQRAFFALLRMFCLSLTVFDAFRVILQQAGQGMKDLLNGCKFTWKSMFAFLWFREVDAFTMLVAVGS